MKDPAAIPIPWGGLPRQFEAAGTLRDEFGAWRMVAGVCSKCGGQVVVATAEWRKPVCGCGGSLNVVTAATVKVASVVQKAARR